MGPPGSNICTPPNRSIYPLYRRKGGAEAVPGCLDIILEVVPGGPETIPRYISEALESISEALEHIQLYFRGYSGACVSPVAFRELACELFESTGS